MTNAERQKRYRERNARNAPPVTLPSVTTNLLPGPIERLPKVCDNCQVLADEVANLKRELAESNARSVPWKPFLGSKVAPSAKREASQGTPHGPSCMGICCRSGRSA